MGSSLLDYLTVETEGSTGCKYPKLQELRRFQKKLGLTYSVLEEVEVREVICGFSSTEETQKCIEWLTEKHLQNQDSFDTGIVSMDVEDVKAFFYDVMRMVRKIVISQESQTFKEISMIDLYPN